MVLFHYRFSEQAHLYELLLAEVLQDLAKYKIQLTHYGDPEHNIAAMSNHNVKVSYFYRQL